MLTLLLDRGCPHSAHHFVWVFQNGGRREKNNTTCSRAVSFNKIFCASSCNNDLINAFLDPGTRTWTPWYTTVGKSCMSTDIGGMIWDCQGLTHQRRREGGANLGGIGRCQLGRCSSAKWPVLVAVRGPRVWTLVEGVGNHRLGHCQ